MKFNIILKKEDEKILLARWPKQVLEYMLGDTLKIHANEIRAGKFKGPDLTKKASK